MSRFSRVSRARYTSPIPPAPMAETTSYGPSRAPGPSGITQSAKWPNYRVFDLGAGWQDDARERCAFDDGRTLGREDRFEHAGHGRGNLDVHLVGRHLRHDFSRAHGVARLLQPGSHHDLALCPFDPRQRDVVPVHGCESSSVARTAATICALVGSARARSGPLGTGTGAAPTRLMGARSSKCGTPATVAATSAPKLPVTHVSCAMTRRRVRRTESTTIPESHGASERRSMISTSIPSLDKVAATCCASGSIDPHTTSVTSRPDRARLADPIGTTWSPSGTSARRACESDIGSTKSTGLSSRMAASMSPLASAGVAGTTTFNPGTWANHDT